LPTSLETFLGDRRTVKDEAEQLWEASICEAKKLGDASVTTEPYRSHDSDCLAMGQLSKFGEQSPCTTRVQQGEIHAHFTSSVCTEKQLEDGRGRITLHCARTRLGGSSRSPVRSPVQTPCAKPALRSQLLQEVVRLTRNLGCAPVEAALC